MKKLLLLPAVMFPYSVCICFAYGFGSGNFSDDPIITALGISCLLCALLAFAGNILFILFSKKQSSHALLKTALLLKIIHIPSYILIFTFGLLMGLFGFVFAIPLLLFLVLIDGITLFFSGMISVFALAKHVKHKKTLSLIAIVCQFFFCADIISLLMLFFIAKKHPAAS